MREVAALEREVAGVVEVTQAAALEVEVLDDDRRLRVLVLVVRARRVGQVKGVGFGAHQLAGREVGLHVIGERAPHVELLDVEAVELAQLVVRRLEERPLVALEVDRGDEAEHRERLEAERVHDLDEDIDVAVLLDPHAVVGVQRVAPVGRGIERGQDGDAAHGPTLTATGARARARATRRRRSRAS